MKKAGLVLLTLGVYALLLMARDDMEPLIRDMEWPILSLALGLIVPGLVLLVASRVNPRTRPVSFAFLTVTTLGLSGSFLSNVFYNFGNAVGFWPELIGIPALLISAVVSKKRLPEYDLHKRNHKK